MSLTVDLLLTKLVNVVSFFLPKIMATAVLKVLGGTAKRTVALTNGSRYVASNLCDHLQGRRGRDAGGLDQLFHGRWPQGRDWISLTNRRM